MSVVINQYNDAWFTNHPDCHLIGTRTEQIKDGRKYTSLSYLRDLGPMERVARLVGALALTVLTAFVGLFLFEGLRNLWIEFYNGQERVDVNDVPAVETTEVREQANNAKDGERVDLSDEEGVVDFSKKFPASDTTIDNAIGNGWEDSEKEEGDKVKADADPKNLSGTNHSSVGTGGSNPEDHKVKSDKKVDLDPSLDSTLPQINHPAVKDISVFMSTNDAENLRIFSESDEERETRVKELMETSKKKGDLAFGLPKAMWVRFLQNKNKLFDNCLNHLKDNNRVSDLFNFIRKLNSDTNEYIDEGLRMHAKNPHKAVNTFNQNALKFKGKVAEFKGMVSIKCEKYGIKFPDDLLCWY